ncbi:MAG: DNA polymerase III subunit alpha [Alicyclobacillaceae bacterium]|nr:DNA polymerase III subunit alpha [Alicyclobacillaceae bacterium]
MDSFVHLHVHTEYSLRESALRVDECVAAAARQGMPAVAITDTDAMYGAVAFYRAARAAGIKPIVGVQLAVALAEADLADERPQAQPPLDNAVLLAEDFKGYQNLVRLVTRARLRARRPYVTLAELGEHNQGVTALVGGGESRLLAALAAGDEAEAERWFNGWCEVWPAGHLAVDVQDHALPEERRGLPQLVQCARRRQLPLVATNDVHYLRRADARVQQVLARLEGGANARVLRGDRYEFADAAEMRRRFAKLPEAIDGALAVAERCNLELPSGRPLLPKYPTPDGEPAASVLRRAAFAGARQRYGEVTEAVRERLEYELSVIERLGFADYFLVVADFIRYAHRQGISTGPGRGSAAGSLVAYALRITDVDPIRHYLLFERFLNPERVSWPDIDTDFEFERRGEVIQYVVERYGADRVAQIGTFGTLAARAAVRDAARVLGADPRRTDELARQIPAQPGITLAAARAHNPRIGALLEADETLRQVWETAEALEGFPRHTSVHAAGVVISPDPLSNLVPTEPGADGTPVTQYSMEDIEYLGLIKMDFLGLKTLTLIDRCVDSVARRTGRRVDWRRVPTDDAATYQMLSRGETDGCFQLESPGVRRVLRELKPTGLEDLIAVISLYRPGPMENIPVFIAAKHGRTPVRYPHPDLEPILRDTYGVIVYQEQIMQIAARMAGFTLGEADILRRAVGKKKREVLEAERVRFVEGCLRRGYPLEAAEAVYDLIARFADYGFNRSHAAAYAVLAFRTAYLKANFLPDFLAALLSLSIGSADKLREYTRVAERHGIRVLPPCVNESAAEFTVGADGTIRTGLLAVRGVGRAAVQALLDARASGPFRSLVDFLRRVNHRVCNRKAVESLLAAGALNRFLPDGVKPAVAVQILDEAYVAAELGEALAGLGLPAGGSPARAGGLPDAGGSPALQPGEGQTGAAGSQTATGADGAVLFIRLPARSSWSALWARIKPVLEACPGASPVALYDSVRRQVRLLDRRWAVTVTPELVAALEEVVGLGNVRLGPKPAQAIQSPDSQTRRGENGDVADDCD